MGPRLGSPPLQSQLALLLEREMTPNSETIDLIKQFEGLRLKAYKDSVGVWTIGYGLTTGALDGVVVAQGMAISEREADAYFTRVLENFGDGILVLMTRQPTLNQYGAMLSLAYNIGVRAFSKSTCLRRFNAGDFEGAATALTWFNKAGGKVLNGLVRRRAAEADLFLRDTIISNTLPTPDPIKPPHKSTTNIAAATAGLSMAASASSDVQRVVANLGIDPKWLFLAVGVAALVWVVKERISKMRNEGV